MLHYFLTGDEASREAAIGLARWVIDMDDGRKTVFRWLSAADTGWPASRVAGLSRPRPRGRATRSRALLDGHRLTGDPAFLRKAEQLIRRVIHPADDVTRMVGLARTKSSRRREPLVLHDVPAVARASTSTTRRNSANSTPMYAYARASLLHYARWMASTNTPICDHPELLEYPTETWAAQDMRKSEVFDFAAMHAVGDERERFLERAEFFYRTAIETLSKMPTRTLCRPLVLLMTQGWRRAWFAAHPEEVRPAPAVEVTDFGRPTAFLPQKVIAVRRAKRIVAGLGLLSLGGVVALVIALLVK